MDFDSVYIVYIVLRFLQGLAAVLCNLPTIVIFIRYDFLRTASNMFIVNLALADLLHGLANISLFPANAFVQNVSLCLTNQAITLLTVHLQLLGFLFIALERYINLINHVRGRMGLEIFTSILMVVILWISCVILMVLMTILMARRWASASECIFINVYYSEVGKFSIIFFVVMSVLISVLYVKIAFFTYKNRRKVRSGPQSQQQIFTTRTNIKLTKMLALMVGIFVILYTPQAFLILLTSDGSQVGLGQIAVLISDAIFWINPIIYAWKCKKFQKAFYRLLGKRLGRIFHLAPSGNTIVAGQSCLPAHVNGSHLMVATETTNRSLDIRVQDNRGARAKLIRVKTSCGYGPSIRRHEQSKDCINAYNLTAAYEKVSLRHIRPTKDGYHTHLMPSTSVSAHENVSGDCGVLKQIPIGNEDSECHI